MVPGLQDARFATSFDVYLGMGRPPRQHYPGAIYHFIARGNNRQAIFLSPADRRKFERILVDGVERFQHRCHSYCWMSNHFHMAIEVSQVPLSHIAHNLLFRYARWFNWKHERTGHLFERRYKAFVVHTDQELLSLVRYVHLNPVRARIVDRPEAYRWSSYAAYLGHRSSEPPWLTRRLVLSLFGCNERAARDGLRSFTEAHDTEPKGEVGGEKVEATREPTALDAESGRRDPGAFDVTLEQVVSLVAAACGLEPHDLHSNVQRRSIVRARALAAYFVREHTHWTLEDLGRALGRDASTLSRAATGTVRRLAHDAETRAALRRIENGVID